MTLGDFSFGNHSQEWHDAREAVKDAERALRDAERHDKDTSGPAQRLREAERHLRSVEH